MSFLLKEHAVSDKLCQGIERLSADECKQE